MTSSKTSKPTTKPTAALAPVTFPSVAMANRAAVQAGLKAFTTKTDGKGGFYFVPGTDVAKPATFAKAIVATAQATKPAKAPEAKAAPVSPLAKALKASVAKPSAKPAKAPAAAPIDKGKRQLPAQALGGKAPAEKAAKGVSKPRADWAKPYDTKGATAGARVGTLPPVPDFSAPTHAGYRNKLAAIVAMVEDGDIAGLLADDTEAKSSSRNAIVRYRDLAIFALQAKAANKAAKADRKAAKAASPAKPAKGKGKPAQPAAQA